jgi:hypothetical protein
MATNRIFRVFCINRFGLGPLHYISSRSDFGFEFAEIFVLEKRLRTSPPCCHSKLPYLSLRFFSRCSRLCYRIERSAAQNILGPRYCRILFQWARSTVWTRVETKMFVFAKLILAFSRKLLWKYVKHIKIKGPSFWNHFRDLRFSYIFAKIIDFAKIVSPKVSMKICGRQEQ